MKKFVIAFCIFLFNFTVQAQCNLNNFSLTQTPGTCYGNAQITVSNASCTSNSEVLVELVSPGNPVPIIEPLVNGSHTFSSLRAGAYTVTLSNQSTGERGAPKSINVTSSYQNITWQLVSVTPPKCRNGNDAQIQLTIRSGGIGNFDVELHDQSGNVVFSQSNLSRPTPTTPINVQLQGNNANPIGSGDFIIVIKDLANGQGGCGATINSPINIAVPPTSSKPECQVIQRTTTSKIQLGPNCKYRLMISLYGTDNWLDWTYYRQPNRALVWNVTTGEGPHDISSTFNYTAIEGQHYRTNYMFSPGDVARIKITGALNTIEETFTVHHLELPVAAIGLEPVPGRNTATMPCGKIYRFKVRQNYQLVTLVDPSDPNKKYRYGYYPWGMYRFDIDYANRASTGKPNADLDKYWYKVEREVSPGNWADVSTQVVWSPGASQIPNGTDEFWADVTNAGGPGTYRFSYLDRRVHSSPPKGCFPTVAPSETKQILDNVNDNYLEQRLQNIRSDYGAYEGTSSFFMSLGETGFLYPIDIKFELLSRADGKPLKDPFPMRLPFMEPNDIQMKVFDPVIEFTNITYSPLLLPYFCYGDFLPGRYRITIKDKCGNTKSREMDLDKRVRYEETVRTETICSNASLHYSIKAKDAVTGLDVSVSPSRAVYVNILRRNNSGNWTTFGVVQQNGSQGSFHNLPVDDYKLNFSNYYYTYSQGFTSMRVPPGNYNNQYVNIISQQKYDSYTFSVTPSVSQLQAEVAATHCDANTGIISATVTSPPEVIRYPLTFELRKKADGSLVNSHTYQGTHNETSHSFANVEEGVYVVVIKHQCGSNEFETEVKLSNFRLPSIFLRRDGDCPGEPITLRLSASEALFDIEWYRMEGSNRIVLGNGNTITQNPAVTTTYYAEYALKPGIGCASTAPNTAQRTVTVRQDTTAPTISGCPSDIEVFAEIDKCTAQVHWADPTATDDCTNPPTMTQTHHSGDVFNIGTQTVTYEFTDAAGNTATCSFNVTVKARNIDLQTNSNYTDGTYAPIGQLTSGQDFFYEIRYKNIGQENIRNATLTVTLPNNPLVTINGTPDVSQAAPGGIAPTFTLNGRVYTFTLPEGTLLTASDERIIRIPLKLTGDCTDLGKPCANYIASEYQFEFQGGNENCISPPQTKTGKKTILASTENCKRSELYCPGDSMTLTAEAGFDTYRWYKDGVLIAGANGQSHVVNAPGVYRVEKETTCEGVSVVSTETIHYTSASTATDPLRPIADGGATCASNGQWTSHFILCNETQRQINLSYINTPNIEWQKLNTGCNNLGFNCPNPNNTCWTTFQSGTSYTANQTGEFRLKVSTATGCDAFFYFNVYKNTLAGQVTKSDYTDYQPGHINIEMETVGLEYTYVLKNTAGQIVAGPVTKTNVADSWQHTFNNLQEGNYVVEVSSPQLPNSCLFTENVRIDKVTQLSMKATFIAWTGCNEVKIRFEAQGGKQPYKFAIWSIDGVALYDNFVSIPATAFIATIPAGQSYTEALITVTQPGRYLFVVQDDEQRAALQADNEAILIEPEGLYGFRFDLTHIACGSNPDSGEVRTHFDRPQNRTTVLYRIDTNGNRVYVDTNNTGVYTGLVAGNYEMEISIRIGTETCTYKKPFTINEAENTLRAFVGVVEDIACDNNSPAGYKVSINNVSGGTGGYQYNFGRGYQTSNVDYVSGSTTVYVKDSAGCTLPLEVVIVPTEIPTLNFTPVTYDCNGYGSFTVTPSATASLTYQYQVDNQPQQTSPTIGPLAPRSTPYNITVHYLPAPGTGTTPNYLFKEDFGTGADVCDGSIIYLGCKQNQALEDGFYAITQQVAANAQWVSPTPTDASAVANGRYLAVMQQTTSGNSGIVYHKTIGNIVAGESIQVSLKLHNLLAANTSGVNPHIVLDFVAADQTLIARKDLGILPADGTWHAKSATFTATELNGVHQASFQIRNISTGAVLGNDIALDDIVIWQNTKYCKAQVSKPIIIEAGKQMTVQLLATNAVSCQGSTDGSLQGKVTAHNLPTNLEYSTDNQASWNHVAVNPDGTFTVNGLPAATGALLYVRDPNEHACVDAFNYTISTPQAIEITTQIIKKIDCQPAPNHRAVVKATASGGTTPYQNFQYKSSSASSWITVTATHNEALLQNLDPGEYQVLVTDKNGCTQTAAFTIADKQPVTFDAFETYCYQGGNTAKIAIQVQNGNSTSYQYSNDGGASWTGFTHATYEFTNLSAGNYDIWVRDELGCTANKTITIAPQLLLDVIQIQDLDCRGNAAIFDLSAFGGKGTKTFSVSTDGGNIFTPIASLSSTTAQFQTAIAGEFIFKVEDQLRPDGFTRCQAISNSYKVSNQPPRWKPNITIGKTDVACAGEATGQILASVNDIDPDYGQAPYSILVYEDDGTGNPLLPTQYGLFNLAAKKYVVVIEDAKGCTATPVPVEITETPALNFTVSPTQISCISGMGISLGKVDITLNQGGTAPFDVKIFKLGTGLIHSASVTNNQTVTQNNLSFGGYSVSITDAANCQKVFDFTINAYTDILITAAPTTAPIGCAPGTGAIQVSAYNTSSNAIGTGNFWFAVYHPGLTYTPGDPQWHLGTAANITLPPPATGTASGATYEFTNLTPGVTYVFAVYDENTNCMYFQQSTIAVPTGSTLKIDQLQVENVKCYNGNDGKVTFSLSGQKPSTTSINYQVFTHPDNTPVPGQSGTLAAPYNNVAISGLTAGEYYIVFTEMNNATPDCVNATAPLQVTQPLTELQVTALSPVNVNCKPASGRIVTSVSGGVAPYQYIYQTTPTPPTDAQWMATTQSSVQQVGTAGTWYVFVKDQAGCVKSYSLPVAQDPAPQIASATIDDLCSTSGKYTLRVKLSTLGVGTLYYRLNGAVLVPVNLINADTFLITDVLPSATPYNIQVVDSNGCADNASVTVHAPIEFTATITKELDCSPNAEATVQINNISGGDGTYFYSIDRVILVQDPNNPSTPAEGYVQHTPRTAVTSTPITVAMGRAADYIIHVFDAQTATCPVKKRITIAEKKLPEITVTSVTDETCHSGTLPGTASISVAVANNGQGPFTIEITQVKDLASGVTTPLSGVIAPSNGYIATFNQLKGSENGMLYTIKATAQGNGCASEIEQMVVAPPALNIAPDALSLTQYTCQGTNTPQLPTISLDVTKISGGTQPYTRYVFFDNATGLQVQNGTNTTYTLGHLNGGSFYVTVYDANGCEIASPPITVAPTLLIDDILVNVDAGITCEQDETISVSIATTPAYPSMLPQPDIRYSLTKAQDNSLVHTQLVAATTYTFPPLPVGQYLITATNTITQCQVTTTHTVFKPDTFVVTATQAQPVTCHAGSDGSINIGFVDTYLGNGDQALLGFSYEMVNAITGAPVHSQTVAPGTTQVTYNQLPAGTYNVRATATANQCKTPWVQFSILQSEAPIEVIAQEGFGVTCTNNQGEILVTITGGKAPYTVTLTAPGFTTQTRTDVDQSVLFTALSAGTSTRTYTVSVTDSQGCDQLAATSLTQVTLTLPDPVTAHTQVTPISCVGANDGVIEVKNTQGGSGNGTYHYILKNLTSGESTQPQTSTLFENLTPGQYALTITDAWNCDVTLTGINIEEPKPITMTITNADLIVCYGGTDTGFAEVSISGGTPNYNLLLKNADTGADLRAFNATTTNVLIDNLKPGINYQITISDTRGCVMEQPHSFTLTQLPNIRANAKQSEDCLNDTYKTEIQVRFPEPIDFGKVKYALNSADPALAVPFNRTSENTAFIDSFNTNIPSQYITIFYQETVNGQTETCTHNAPFQVVNRQALTLNQVPNSTLNTIEVSATGGVPPYQYYFNGNYQSDNPLYRVRIDDPEQIDPNTGKKVKVVNISVIDAVGCTQYISLTIEYIDIEIPNFFTPDGDGNNDQWGPKNTQNYPFMQTHIFDRYGRKITTLNQNQKWDGKYNKKNLPTGDYWYIIQTNDPLDKRTFKGHFTLYR